MLDLQYKEIDIDGPVLILGSVQYGLLRSPLSSYRKAECQERRYFIHVSNFQGLSVGLIRYACTRIASISLNHAPRLSQSVPDLDDQRLVSDRRIVLLESFYTTSE